MGIRTELQLRLPNSPGAAASVCGLLANQRVDTLGMMLDAHGHLHLIVDNHVRAIGALREGHHRVTERDVLYVRVPPGPGGLAPVLKMIGDAGVNVDYAYCAHGSDGAAVVVGLDDAQRVAALTGL